MDQSIAISESSAFAEGPDGLRVFYRCWRPGAAARATLTIVPGFNSHSGYYQWAGRELAARGVVVYALDLRGRGQSDGERFYVESFDDYVADVALISAIVAERDGSLPRFLMGHSAGGVVACLSALDQGEGLAGLISESFAFELPAPDFALAVLKGLSHLAPHARVLALKNADFSRDPDVVERMNADALIAHETQPTKTLAAIVRADQRLRRQFSQITAPLLILHGTDDHAAKPEGSKFFYAHAGSADRELKLYEGAYHDPLNDKGREQVLDDIAAWLLQRAG
jgi:alpha-beta hydrolase superfamily lysophospholipase